MKIDRLNWEWALDTIDMLRDSVEAATVAHDRADADLRIIPISGEMRLRRSIRNSLKSVQRNLADSVVSIRGILSDQEKINTLHNRILEENPISESDIPF